MKNIHILFACALALTFSFSSCKKKDDDPKPTLKSFSFPTSTDVIVELSWTVNGQAAGNTYADLDFDIYNWDAANTTYTNYGGSSSGSTFESETLSGSASNYSSTLGVIYYANETNISTLSSPYTIAYTFKVYPVGNVAAAQFYNGTIVNPPTSPSSNIVYNLFSVVKTGSTFSFNELASKTTFDYSIVP